jgi:long-subunit acyl-CoA synthetase (AMP-forming)
MLKSSSKVIFRWNQHQQQLLRAASINIQKSKKIHVFIQNLQKRKDFEDYHEQMVNFKPITMLDFVNKTVAEFGEHTALMHKKEGSSEWTPITYNEYKMKIEQVAKAFIKLGLEEDGKVAVLAFNSAEWFLSQFGAMFAK